MKKLLFACVCAATVAAFADPLNKVGFEGYAAGTSELGLKTDDGTETGQFFWWYEAANGSTDGSQVKAYGGEENLPAFVYAPFCGVPDFFKQDEANTRYLELSTEGGTLWRSVYDAGSAHDGPGEPESLYTDSIYVDTLVQFTPTEDGEIPQLEQTEDSTPDTPMYKDKLALWLNVDATDEEHPVTNLCVYAAVCSAEDGSIFPTKFTLTNAPKINPETWYRLTVKIIPGVAAYGSVPGFMIYIDGVLMQSDVAGIIAESDLENFIDDPAILDAVNKKAIFCSVATVDNNNSICAVGFKGSGKVDDFAVTYDTPAFLTSTGALDFTLTWDENVSAVSYTIGETTTEITGDTFAAGTTTFQVAAGALVTVAATPKDWYVIADGTGEVSVNETTTKAVTTALAASPEAAGAGTAFGELTTAMVKDWADAKSLTPAQIAACEYAMDAYLLNTGLDAAPALAITSIEETDGGWNITVKATAGENDVTLDGINGALKVKTAATLGGLADAAAQAFTVTVGADGVATIKVTGDNTNFMKATVVAQ